LTTRPIARAWYPWDFGDTVRSISGKVAQGINPPPGPLQRLWQLLELRRPVETREPGACAQRLEDDDETMRNAGCRPRIRDYAGRPTAV